MRKTLALMVLLSVLVLGLVQAGSITVPAADTELCGATATFTYVTTLSDTTNVTLWRSLVNGSLPYTNIASIGNTSANQSSFTITYDTTGLTDSTSYVFNMTATDGSGFESGLVNASTDNTGPVLSFAAANTKNNDYAYSEDFYISITSDETIVAPTVDFKGQKFTLSGSTTAWTYDFGVNALRDDTYVYSITGTDDSSCSNSGNPITRTVNIYSKTKSGVIANAQDIAEQEAAKKDSKTVAILILAAAVYVVFFRQGNGKGKKK